MSRKPKAHYNISILEIQSRLDSGMSQREIAKDIDISREYLRKICKEYSIQISDRRKQPLLSKELLETEHFQNKLKLTEIAKKYGRSHRSIKHTCKVHGLKPIDHRAHHNSIKRQKAFQQTDLDQTYGTITKIEIQKKLGVGQLYLDAELERLGIRRRFFNQSSHERELYDWLVTVYNGQIETNVCNVIPPKEIDVWLPQKKIGIEIHGLYWHSARAGIDKFYHQEKSDLAEQHKVTLLQFFEDEWIHQKEICKSIILSKLGLITTKLMARKCVVRVVDSSTAKEFSVKNHLQGHAAATAYLGLFHEDEMVGLMSFRKTRFGNKSGWEIIRLCFSLNVSVTGGPAKLLSHFIKHWQPESIHSYSDRRISTGKVYHSIGFTFSKKTGPGYSYVVNKKRSNRMNWQKSKLSKKLGNTFDPRKTEMENMIVCGYYPIYDAGNYLWIYKK